jgi:large repetitive protein
VVDQISTTTIVTASPNPSTFGQTVTFTAIETPSDGGGSVAFYADGSITPISGCGARPLALSAGTYQASCPTSTLGAGPHSISATYTGDTDYAGSSGSLPGGQVVSRASTGTTLASSVNPSVHHQPVTFTATVVPTDGSGTVAFLAGTKTIPHCGAQTLSLVGADYEATCTDSSLKVGPHAITATYSGDTDYLPSTSTALIQKVKDHGAPAFITPVLGSPQSSPVGVAFVQPLGVEVTDLYGNVIPGALVTFTAPATGPSGTFPPGFTSTTAVTDSGGHAMAPTLTANSIVGGPYDVTASIGAVSGSFVLTNLPPVPETAVSVVPTHVDLAGGGTTPAFLVSAMNTGLVPTVGTLTITDTLSNGLSFTGQTLAGADQNGWNCSFSGQVATCAYSNPIGVGDLNSVALYVAVTAAPGTALTDTAVLTPANPAAPQDDTATAQVIAGDF